MAGLSLGASTHRGPSFDELAHMTAGASYLAHHDYRYQPENGLLPQALAALPLSWDAGVDPPPAEGKAWARGDVWTAGRTWLFGQLRPPARMLLASRATILALALALAVLVWRMARTLWGPTGGLVSLALCALCPELLAHGAMATSDLAAALFFLAATGAIWSLLARPGIGLAVLAGAALAGLALSKASAVLIAPVAVLLVLARVRTRTLGPAGVTALSLVLAAVVALGGIWTAYGARWSAFAPPDDAAVTQPFSKPLEPMLERAGALEPALRAAFTLRVLPEAWLYGFTFVVAHSHARPAFLRGEHRDEGWWWFFPYAFLVKTPLALLALLLVGLLAAARRRPPGLLPLLSLLVVYWGFSLTSHLNIGSRHLLPTLPPLFVAAGAAGVHLERAGRARLAVGGLLALLLLDVGVAYPQYLGYFNPLVGGARNAWRHLVDSSLDWGQDGPALAEALDDLAAPDEPVWLAWFGSADPRSFGIEARSLPSTMPWQRPGDPPPLTPGLYAISATQLQGVYLPRPGPWTASHEAAYQQGRERWREWLLSGGDDAARSRLLSAAPEPMWRGWLADYEVLRFQRLTAWLRDHGEPVGRAGTSVLIYRLSEADLSAALGGDAP